MIGGGNRRRNNITPPLDALFAMSISNFTIASVVTPSTIDTLRYNFTATAGHGIAIGNELLLLDVVADWSLQCVALNVVTNLITIDRPIDHAFAAGSLGRIVTTNMVVDGSVTPKIFTVRAGAIPVEATRFMLTMTSTSPMDDARFGGIDALTRGLVFRIVNGFQKTVFCFKSNQEIKQFCFDVDYSDKAPAGSNGLVARLTFNGEHTHDDVLRFKDTDALQWVVQDNLTVGGDLTTLVASAQGREEPF